VQPAQASAAAHQATQVSPAQTQAQPRATNGTPAPAQAGAKQGANGGKEDDEDWWTE
jgi:hypothetical protein